MIIIITTTFITTIIIIIIIVIIGFKLFLPLLSMFLRGCCTIMLGSASEENLCCVSEHLVRFWACVVSLTAMHLQERILYSITFMF